MNDVVERLKEIRSILNETQKSMSLRLGMSENTWQSYERGIHFPKFETLEKLYELGFNPGWIVTGEGPMRPGETEEGQTPPSAKKEHHPEDTISKKIAFNVMIALAPHFGITKEPAQDELAKLFLDLCDYVRENSNGTSAEIIDFGMRRVNRSQAS